MQHESTEMFKENCSFWAEAVLVLENTDSVHVESLKCCYIRGINLLRGLTDPIHVSSRTQTSTLYWSGDPPASGCPQFHWVRVIHSFYIILLTAGSFYTKEHSHVKRKVHPVSALRLNVSGYNKKHHLVLTRTKNWDKTQKQCVKKLSEPPDPTACSSFSSSEVQ